MRFIGNVLWFLLGGLEMAIVSFIEAIICFVTIIFIPIGFQQIKLAGFYLWPMGKRVVTVNHNGFKSVINFIWAITGGWINALINLLIGVVLCITIIGIPFGKQYFKVAAFVLTPLGHDFVR